MKTMRRFIREKKPALSKRYMKYDYSLQLHFMVKYVNEVIRLFA